MAFTGMMMLPASIEYRWPFKVIFFVLIDGWIHAGRIADRQSYVSG